MDNSNKTLIAFLAGAAAGVAIGMLMAPDNGRATRDKLGRQADSLINDLEDQWEVGFQKIKELTDNALEEAENLRARGEEELEKRKS